MPADASDPEVCSGYNVSGSNCEREHETDGTHTYPADDGHTFRVTAEIRGSYGVVGEEHHTDTDSFGGGAFVREIRAWDLPQAMRVLATLPLASWVHEERSQVDRARDIAVELEGRIAGALEFRIPPLWDLDDINDLLDDDPLKLRDYCCELVASLRTITQALQPDVYDEEESPAHHAEMFREDDPDLRFGWQCFTCKAEEYVGDAATAAAMAEAHNDGRLLLIDGLTMLWPEPRRPGAGYPLCPGCGHDFGQHHAVGGGWDIACPACYNVGGACTVDQVAVFAAIQAAER